MSNTKQEISIKTIRNLSSEELDAVSGAYMQYAPLDTGGGNGGGVSSQFNWTVTMSYKPA